MAVVKQQSDTMQDNDIGTPGGETLVQRHIQYVGTVVKATCDGITFEDRVVKVSIPAFVGDPSQFTTWSGTADTEESDILADIVTAYGGGS
jgi:hypothetical protein